MGQCCAPCLARNCFLTFLTLDSTYLVLALQKLGTARAFVYIQDDPADSVENPKPSTVLIVCTGSNIPFSPFSIKALATLWVDCNLDAKIVPAYDVYKHHDGRDATLKVHSGFQEFNK